MVTSTDFARGAVDKKVIDLFAGVGGLSLGAARAGFQLAAAVELDLRAVETHGKNFPNSKHFQKDVSALTGVELLELAGVAAGTLSGLIGGPPCQGFSEIGLRTEADPRNELLGHFFRLAAETRPAFFLAENVPGVLLERNANQLKAALSWVPDDYVLLDPIKVTASNYGAPTSRTRVFFLGYDPKRVNALSSESFKPNEIEDVRVRAALAFLPALRSEWQTEAQSWRSVGKLESSQFADRLHNAVPLGVGDPYALESLASRSLVSGFLGTIHAEETVKRFKALRPGERDSISRAPRLDPAGYCPTLRAGTGPERGSFQAVRPVHPTSPRVISPREAARLQGFPDWFQFHHTKWHAFRQIGNSVSPIVAERLLSVIEKAVD